MVLEESKMAEEEEDLVSLRRAVMSSISEKGTDIRVIRSTSSSRHKYGMDKVRNCHEDLHGSEKETKKRKSTDNYFPGVHEKRKTDQVQSHVQIVRRHKNDSSFVITVENDVHKSKKASNQDDRSGNKDGYEKAARRYHDDRIDSKDQTGHPMSEDEDVSDIDSDYTFEMRSQRESGESDYSVEFTNVGNSDDEGSDIGKENVASGGSIERNGNRAKYDSFEEADFEKVDVDDAEEDDEKDSQEIEVTDSEKGEDSEDNEKEEQSLKEAKDFQDDEREKIGKETVESEKNKTAAVLDGFTEIDDDSAKTLAGKRVVTVHNYSKDKNRIEERSTQDKFNPLTVSKHANEKEQKQKPNRDSKNKTDSSAEQKPKSSIIEEDLSRQLRVVEEKLEKLKAEAKNGQKKEELRKEIPKERVKNLGSGKNDAVSKKKDRNDQGLERKPKESLSKDKERKSGERDGLNEKYIPSKEMKKGADKGDFSDKTSIKLDKRKEDAIADMKPLVLAKVVPKSSNKRDDSIHYKKEKISVTGTKRVAELDTNSNIPSKTVSLSKVNSGKAAESKNDSIEDRISQAKKENADSFSKTSGGKLSEALKGRFQSNGKPEENGSKRAQSLSKSDKTDATNKKNRESERKQSEGKETVKKSEIIKKASRRRKDSMSSEGSTCSTCSGSGSSSSGSSTNSSSSGSESGKTSRSGSSSESSQSSSDSESSSSEEENFKRRRRRASETKQIDSRTNRKSISPRKGRGRGYVSPLRTKKSEWGRRREADNKAREKRRDSPSPREHSYLRSRERSRDRRRRYSRSRSRQRRHSRSRSKEYIRRGREYSRDREKGRDRYRNSRRSRQENYDRRDRDRNGLESRSRKRSSEQGHVSIYKGSSNAEPPVNSTGLKENDKEEKVAKESKEKILEKGRNGICDKQPPEIGGETRELGNKFLSSNRRSRSPVKSENGPRKEKKELIAKSAPDEDKNLKPLMEQTKFLKDLKNDKVGVGIEIKNGDKESIKGNVKDPNKESAKETKEMKDVFKRKTSLDTVVSKKSVDERKDSKREKPRPLMEITLSNVKKPVASSECRPLRRVSVTKTSGSTDESSRHDRDRRRLVTSVNKKDSGLPETEKQVGSRENCRKSFLESSVESKLFLKRLSSGKSVVLERDEIEPLMRPMDFEFNIVGESRVVERKQVRRVVTDSRSNQQTPVLEITAGDVDEFQPQHKRKVFSRLGKGVVNKQKSIAINLSQQSAKEEDKPIVTVKNEEEMELDQRIKQIREKNEEIMRRQKEIEDDIKLNS